MSGHEITIGDASVTFEQVEVELDYNDILLNIEDTISERITDQIGDEAWVAAAKGAPPEYGYVRVRAIVREELATVLSAFAKAVNAQLGAEIAVAPGD